MTENEILDMWGRAGGGAIKGMPYSLVERFAALVASAERERLAKVFDERDKDIGWYDPGEPAEIIRGQA